MVERSLSTGGKMSAPYLRLMGSNSNKLHVQVMILNNFLFLFYKHPHTLFFSHFYIVHGCDASKFYIIQFVISKNQ